MKRADKAAFTQFAMEFTGTHYNVRFSHRIYPIPRISVSRQEGYYHLEIQTRKGNKIIYVFDSQGQVTSRFIG